MVSLCPLGILFWVEGAALELLLEPGTAGGGLGSDDEDRV